ncbi:MAG: 50S ribosomal protein L9 [Chloroflexota bacterium]|nr:50S ribosomal protein L9 [Chloroflexota bacterium]
MKVLLIKDVYKLGRAGEVKKVAAGYGRNYLIPQGFAIAATPGAMGQADRIKEKATERRAVLNEELGSVAEVLDGKTLLFAVKAGETGRLYGSVSDEDIIEAVKANFEIELEKRQVETEPIRDLGSYTVPVHLTMDLMPTLKIIVHREGEVPGEEEALEEIDLEGETEVVSDDPESRVIEEVSVLEEAPEEEETSEQADAEDPAEEAEPETKEAEADEEDTEA